MKSILVPTDFSENAYSALQYATQLFANESCKFTIVHSFESQVSNLTSRIDIGKTEAVVDDLYTTYEAKCEEVIQKIISENRNDHHTFHSIATSLLLSNAINKLIVKEQVDFVVMGSKGRTAAHDMLVGSNTVTMIRKIKNSPLLVIPKEIAFKPIKKIAFATGFKRPFDSQELQPLLFISILNKASVNILHINKEEKLTPFQRAHLHQLNEILKEAHPERNWFSGESDIYEAITSFLHKLDIDLLAMHYYKHNALVRLFREATVKEMAKHTHIPFLILPTKA